MSRGVQSATTTTTRECAVHWVFLNFFFRVATSTYQSVYSDKKPRSHGVCGVYESPFRYLPRLRFVCILNCFPCSHSHRFTRGTVAKTRRLVAYSRGPVRPARIFCVETSTHDEARPDIITGGATRKAFFTASRAAASSFE